MKTKEEAAKERAERETKRLELKGRLLQKERDLSQVLREIAEPGSTVAPGTLMDMNQIRQRTGRMKEHRENLTIELGHLRENLAVLDREDQAAFAQEQWELTQTATARDREFADRQDAFTREQWKLTRKTQIYSVIAAWTAGVATVIGVAAAFYNAYLIKHQPPPICSPAQVHVQAPPPIPPPEVTVTLDSKALPLKKVVTPKGALKQKP